MTLASGKVKVSGAGTRSTESKDGNTFCAGVWMASPGVMIESCADTARTQRARCPKL